MLSPGFLSRSSSVELFSPELASPPSSSQSFTPTPTPTPTITITTKRPRTTWIWSHMPDSDPETQYFNRTTRKLEWRCRYCTRQYTINGGTRAIMGHLKTHKIQENSTRATRAINQQVSI